jgi:hypothetical protein
MTRLRGSLIAAAVPLFLIGACAQPAADGAGAPAPGIPESSAALGAGADDLVLRAESFGGFVPPDRVIGAIPSVSVYADGRVITEGPVPAIYPGPALPNMQVTQLDPAQVQALVAASGPAGVRNGADFGQPNVADAPNTRVIVRTPAGTQTVTAAALNEAQPQDPMLTPEQVAARTKLSAFVKSLTDLPADQSAVKPYAPEALAVLARPWTDPGGAEPAQPAKAWAGPALPGDYLNPTVKIGCVLVTGAEKDKIWKAAGSANAMTPWTAGSGKFLITFRPLLPDENDCAVLKGKA